MLVDRTNVAWDWGFLSEVGGVNMEGGWRGKHFPSVL